MDVLRKILDIAKPKYFSEIVGNVYCVNFITRLIKMNMIPNAILLCGHLGCGKTTLARLYTKSVNCKNRKLDMSPCYECETCNIDIDILEFNSSNYSLVDNIREIICNINVLPFISKVKFYILDEVHSLSSKSFNILLKEIEDTPEYTRFVFITNDISNIPDTFLSRCFIISIEKPDNYAIFNRLQYVYNRIISEKIITDINVDTINIMDIAYNSFSVREAINNLAECIIIGSDKLSNKYITIFMIKNIIDLLINKSMYDVIKYIKYISDQDINIKQLIYYIIDHINIEISKNNTFGISYNNIVRLIETLTEGYRMVSIIKPSYLSVFIKAYNVLNI